MARRLLFCSAHLYGDPASGAALSARDLLVSLAARGWACRALCGSMTAFEDGRPADRVLAGCGVGLSRVDCPDGPSPFSLLYYRDEGVPVTVYDPAGWGVPPGLPDGFGLVAMLDALLGASGRTSS